MDYILYYMSCIKLYYILVYYILLYYIFMYIVIY